MAWRDRRDHEQRPDPWEDRRQRRRSPIAVWEHERERSGDRFRQEDRFSRERETRYDRDRRDYDRRFERDDRGARPDRNNRDSFERNDRFSREDKFERNDRFEREDRLPRDYGMKRDAYEGRHYRDERPERDYEDRSRYEEENLPKAPSPPTLTEHEKEEMRLEMRDGGEASVPSVGDWYCVCGALNFKRRPSCYRRGCQYGRAEGTVYGGDAKLSEPQEEVKLAGITKRLLFRRLDTLTNEEKILDVLKKRVPKIVDTITGITIGKDSLTGTSRGLAYISFASITDSTAAHTELLKLSPHLRIDNREVLISYCHNNPKANNTLHQSNLDYTHYMQQGMDYGSSSALSEADRINAAAAVAQSAISAAQARSMWMPHAAPTFIASSNQMTATVEPPDGKGSVKYSPPDVRTFLYDETSGYYYDPATALYYDGSTQYFYNNKLNAYLYWDAANSTYYLATQNTQNTEQPKLPSPPQANSQNTITKEPEVAAPVEEKKKEKDREDKVKVAKKIAKDMARWAKTLNQKKENARNGLVMEQILDTSASKGSADIGFSVLGASGPAFPQIVREISPIPPDEEFLVKKPTEEAPVETDEGIIDWSKLTCLLCKRRFPSADVLTKHKNMSDLHKQNLEEHKKNTAMEQIKNYRDRAAERRMKYGEDGEPIKNVYLPPPPVVVQHSQSSVVDTIGGKMLQKMGWSEGRGLGKEEQGRTAPVEAEKRVALAGLGQKRGIYTAAPGETYRDTVKKLMIARYKDLVGDEE